jgi:hypothetical protein
MWKLWMKASVNGALPFDCGSSDKKSSVSPVRLKDDLINIETIKKQIKARQNSIKSTGKLHVNAKSDIRSERQISDPKKLLDEFMLPHATIMACSRKTQEKTTMHWRKKAKAAISRQAKHMISKPKIVESKPLQGQSSFEAKSAKKQ